MSEQQNPFEQVLNTQQNTAGDPFAQVMAGGQNAGSQVLSAPVSPQFPAANPQGAAAPVNVPVDAANVVQQAAPGAVPAQYAAPTVDLGNQANVPNVFEAPGGFAPPIPTPPPQQPPVADPGVQPPAGFVPQPPPAAPPPQPVTPPDFSSIGADGQTGLQQAQGAAAGEVENPLAAAVENQGQESLFTKLPVFEHGAVKEPIENLTQTFEELREAKSEDFPELEDAVRVSWEVNYGKIRKTVPTPKKTKIGDFKRSIESSKEFLDALKKDKDKNPTCVIKPKITAQSKGEMVASYKGVFTDYDEAMESGKVICIVPARDGNVYEIRNEEAGQFVTTTKGCRELSEIRAGFNPALPLIPRELLLQIIGFFRSLMINGNYEAIANILWDREEQEYCIHVPEQSVSAVKAESSIAPSDEYDSERFLHYMDVHSHNTMSARFSKTDDADEKATRLYTVIGKLNDFIPEISVRISNGGKYLLIDPAIVFDSFSDYYPTEWNDRVTLLNGGRRQCDEPSGFEAVRHFSRFFRIGRGMCA